MVSSSSTHLSSYLLVFFVLCQCPRWVKALGLHREKTSDDKARDSIKDPKKDAKKASNVVKESVAKQSIFPCKK